MTTQEVLSKLTDEDIEKMKACADQDAVYAYLQPKGLTDSADTFKAVANELNEAAAKLNPDEIEAVSGGVDTTSAVCAGVLITMYVGGASGAAAAC